MISGEKNMKTWKYKSLSLKRRKTLEGKKSQIIFDKKYNVYNKNE